MNASNSGEQDRYRRIFNEARVALWDQDFSGVWNLLQELRKQGVADIRSYFEANPEELKTALGRIVIRDVNHYAVELFEAESKEELISRLESLLLPETYQVFLDELAALWDGKRQFAGDTLLRTLKGKTLHVTFTMTWNGEHCEQALASVLDISKQRMLQRRFEALTRTARILSTDLDLERIVQSLTDIAVELSGAGFGAFFYNVIDGKGERYVLYTLSGVPREAFSKFPLPRNTAVFDPTFKGTDIVRSDDITKDPRYGKNAPHHGMPKGHLPVVSYLAVPVISRSGEVHGGVFLGHHEAGVFTGETEDIVVAIAGQATVAIDNARLMQSAKREIEDRRLAEEAAQRLAAIVQSSDDAIVSKDLTGTIRSWNTGAQRLFGYTADEVIGKPVTILMPPERVNEEPGILARIKAGERIEHYETIRRHKDGSLLHISLSVSPILDGHGKVVGASKIARDISDRKKMERQRELLMAELSHRVKNTLATVLSIERLSFAGQQDVATASAAFRARVQALAHAHTRLAEASWISVSLEDLIGDTLAPYRNPEGSNVVLTGPPVRLSPRSALSLSLAIHELATNAAKHGALSSAGGRVDIGWRVADAGALEVIWSESGGPAVSAPRRTGFGRMLLERALQQELGCTVSLDFRVEGLRCSIHIPQQEYENRFN